MSNNIKMLYLPDVLANWPWKRKINPMYEEVKEESNAWLRTFKPFSPQAQYAFDKCDFTRLAALTYPDACKEHLRTGADLMNLFFVIDEYTDVEPAHVVRGMVDIIIDAFHNPNKPRPEGEDIVGEIARQFWALAIKTATPTSQRHMVECFTAYLESVVEQARDRDNNTFRSIESYFINRRENIGTRPSNVPLELSFDFPDEVFYHPIIVELTMLATDMIILGNDMASYNKEQATGDDRHNVLTLAMREFNTNLDGAMAWAVKHHANLEAKFMDGMKRIPSWGAEMDSQVLQYMNGIANWVRGSDCWNFESGRYFGSKGLEIQRTRRVPLYAKVTPPREDETLRRENVVIPLIEALEARG